ncbi:MAG: DUF123 domain-containing protein [Candidatus Latescibacteria bacterium]|nr:DUF123 domain-containing protein [Candidatus Latescibacterota bacterium]
MNPEESPIIVLGSDSQSGCYILRVRLAEYSALAFGGFKRGKIIELPAGEYVYVGSAMSKKGAASLANRLVRHATRSHKKRSHRIRGEMLRRFNAIGLGNGSLKPTVQKNLHWNIDHLLDLPVAELTGACILRTREHLEARLGQFLERDPHTIVVENGLGANDVPGNTHLLRLVARNAWWTSLPERLRKRFDI